MNPYIEDGIDRLRSRWPQAHYEHGKHGGSLIIIPSIILPCGYQETICTVLFEAPPGFPGCVPNHFFTDIDIHLRNGRCPERTYCWHPTLEQGNFPANIWPAWRRAMWWSWSLQGWNPNRDSLYTFMRVVERRLSLAR